MYRREKTRKRVRKHRLIKSALKKVCISDTDHSLGIQNPIYYITVCIFNDYFFFNLYVFLLVEIIEPSNIESTSLRIEIQEIQTMILFTKILFSNQLMIVTIILIVTIISMVTITLMMTINIV